MFRKLICDHRAISYHIINWINVRKTGYSQWFIHGIRYRMTTRFYRRRHMTISFHKILEHICITETQTCCTKHNVNKGLVSPALSVYVWDDDVIKWKHLMFSLICAWTNGWVNNRDAVDLRGHRAHNVVIVMEHFKFKHLQLSNFATCSLSPAENLSLRI